MAGARNDDPVPPRAVPEFRERPVHGDLYADRRRDEPLAERGGVGGNDDIVVFETRRPAVEVRPWYREPQRWIESLNPF
jgi:hypothetical protein